MAAQVERATLPEQRARASTPGHVAPAHPAVEAVRRLQTRHGWTCAARMALNSLTVGNGHPLFFAHVEPYPT